MHLRLNPFDNSSQLLTCPVWWPGIVHAVLQVPRSPPTGRALPQKFFGSYIGTATFVVRDLEYEFIDLYEIIVHQSEMMSERG